MIRSASVLVLGMLIANTALAQGTAAGTMRVITYGQPAGGAATREVRPETLAERMRQLDADVVMMPRRESSVILSRHRIADQREVELCAETPDGGRCTAMVVSIDQPGVPGGLWAVSAHLTSRSGAVSLQGAARLASLVASLPGPVVLASDLAPSQRPMVDALTAGTPDAAAVADAPADHLLSTVELPPSVATVEVDALGSGHIAVVAELTLHPPVPVLPMRRASVE